MLIGVARSRRRRSEYANLYGYLELLDLNQQAQFKKSAKILQREASKIFGMVRAIDEEADGTDVVELCKRIRGE